MPPLCATTTALVFAAAVASLASLRGVAGQPILDGAPIWAASSNSSFMLLRGPDFALRGPPSSARLLFTSLASLPPESGTVQAKLLGAAAVYVNNVLVTIGPGHNIPTHSQLVRGVDVLPFLRATGPNTLGVSSFFTNAAAKGATPRFQAVLVLQDATGSYNATQTGAGWTAWGADTYYNPTGNAGTDNYYFMPNEDLDRRVYPLGWATPGVSLNWAPVKVQPDWQYPLYLEAGAPPTLLVRRVCAVTQVSPTRQILDYGQEFMGGVNLSFTAGTLGAKVTVTLAEEMNGASVRSPLRTTNKWVSTWTLSGNATLDAGVHHHEFVQFRYAQIDGSPDAFVAGSAAASAWVVQHPTGGSGRNPWEHGCSTSVPVAEAFGAAAAAAPDAPIGSWASSNAALDTVFNFSAYTIVATSLDVNVDGQTRERDVDVVDALITELGQSYIFGAADASIQRRTMLEMMTNDTGAWTQW